MKRLCFGRQPADTRYRYHPGLPFSEGLPRSNDASYAAINRNFYLTSNKGNMLIGEGAARIFDCDRNYSAMLSIHVLYNHYQGSDDAIGWINKNFDALVLPMANEIRPNLNHRSLVDALTEVKIPIVVLGMGMQNDLGPDMSELDPSTAELLHLLEEKAHIFGVRGFYTEAWLRSQGLKKPVAMGCPSMMLYPRNILSIKAPEGGAAGKRFMTAGYLTPQSRRGLQLSRFFEGQDVSYVFQDEIFAFKSELADRRFFNDATNQLDAAALKPLMDAALGTDTPFRRYFHFDSVESWRQSYSWHDVFIGDRFHGAVAALQTGLPTAILHKDLRVKEMSEFFGIPNATMDEAHAMGLEAFLTKHLSGESIARFHQTYRERVRNFQSIAEAGGLRFVDRIEDDLLGAPQARALDLVA
jgi:hypothetical protein